MCIHFRFFVSSFQMFYHFLIDTLEVEYMTHTPLSFRLVLSDCENWPWTWMCTPSMLMLYLVQPVVWFSCRQKWEIFWLHIFEDDVCSSETCSNWLSLVVFCAFMCFIGLSLSSFLVDMAKCIICMYFQDKVILIRCDMGVIFNLGNFNS